MLINGKPGLTLAGNDRGFHYGDGVFETIRVIRSKPVLWDYHDRRLTQACGRLRIPLDRNLLAEEMHGFLEESPAEGVLKIIVSRGPGGRGYKPPVTPEVTRVLQFHSLPEQNPLKRQKGIAVIFCRQTLGSNKTLAGIKHLNRLDQVLASMELVEGIDEGLMLSEQGMVVEATRSNLFAALEGSLITPDLSLAGVNGIMREYLMDCFQANGETVKVQSLRPQELCKASEIFLCNSVFGVWPVTKLLGQNRVHEFSLGLFCTKALYFQDQVF
jgi:4-amino-4-deoxychorismate lyase